MPDSHPTTGDAVAVVLEQLDVSAAFGVISVHNMPILDAIGRRGRIRFVAARGEAGAVAPGRLIARTAAAAASPRRRNHTPWPLSTWRAERETRKRAWGR